LRELEQEPLRYPKYGQFLLGFVKLLAICERMVTLLKCCGMKSQVNTVKILKICKDMKSRYAAFREEGQDVLLPEIYKELIKAGIVKNRSLYDIHADFSGVYEAQPVCSICLLEIGFKGEKIAAVEYAHYACLNLLV
jgi:hypothetical protein